MSCDECKGLRTRAEGAERDRYADALKEWAQVCESWTGTHAISPQEGWEALKRLHARAEQAERSRDAAVEALERIAKGWSIARRVLKKIKGGGDVRNSS